MADNMPTLRNDLAQVARKARLTAAVHDVDKIIARLVEAREQIAAEGQQDPHAASLILTKLQNPVKEGFDRVNDDLKASTKTNKEFGRALDRSFPVTPLPTDHDAMATHTPLINRAIAMHLLREGHFDVARVFMDEVRETATNGPGGAAAGSGDSGSSSGSVDLLMGGSAEPTTANRDVSGFAQIESHYLQERFQKMYAILQDIKAHNLDSAIAWARDNSAELEMRGSNLEFELCKLQFIWLTKPGEGNDDGSDNDYYGMSATTGNLGPAFAYARSNFDRFSERHVAEIQRLAAALVFASNIGASPYATAFETDAAFGDVAAVFTREYCSMLGLSAESPLYVAATAGVIALPRLIKFIGATRSKRTEWTTADEMAFETPLPASMMYHPIFVCPVSKEQTTEANPPMRLPCGHVLANDSLRKMIKGTKYKCPYCPAEGMYKDAQQIYL